jgi:hypothetical protein
MKSPEGERKTIKGTFKLVTDTYDHTAQLILYSEEGESVAAYSRGRDGVHIDIAGTGIVRSCLEKWHPGFFTAKTMMERSEGK